MRMSTHEFLHYALTGAALAIGVAVMVFALSAHGKPQSVALQGFNGQDLGTLRYETLPGGTTLHVALNAMAQGWYEMKIHEKGTCTGQSDFSDAGMPIGTVTMERNDDSITANDEKAAGRSEGMIADATGAAEAEFFASNATHNRLNDQDGTAVIIHSLRPEDTEAGRDPMVACGVIYPPQP